MSCMHLHVAFICRRDHMKELTTRRAGAGGKGFWREDMWCTVMRSNVTRSEDMIITVGHQEIRGKRVTKGLKGMRFKDG